MSQDNSKNGSAENPIQLSSGDVTPEEFSDVEFLEEIDAYGLNAQQREFFYDVIAKAMNSWERESRKLGQFYNRKKEDKFFDAISDDAMELWAKECDERSKKVENGNLEADPDLSENPDPGEQYSIKKINKIQF